jgi:1,4-alpha-glucan branching enzyme
VTTLPTASPALAEMNLLIAGEHHDPHSVLGNHPCPDGTVIRVLKPGADAVEVVFGSDNYQLHRIHDAGLFSAQLPHESADYRLVVHYGEHTQQVDDPYRW